MSIQVSDWLKCYGDGWGKRLRPAAYSHPAKASYALTVRIYEHALEKGWIAPGQVVLDPFAGIGGFALEAMHHGLHFIGCELEMRFVDMGQGCDCSGINKADWVRFQGRWDRARYKDGRHWCPECVMKAGAVAGERKFKVAEKRKIKPLPLPGTKWGALAKTRQATIFDAVPSASYMRNSGKIPCTGAHRYHGNIETWEQDGMPGTAVIVQGDSRRLGEVLATAQLALSSPPFGNTRQTKDKDFLDNWCQSHGRNPDAPCRVASIENYGSNPQNLGNLPDTGFEAALAISSPAWMGSDMRDGGSGLLCSHAEGRGRNPDAPSTAGLSTKAPYGNEPGQLAQMPEGDLALAISSPPFRGVVLHDGGPVQQQGGKLHSDYGTAAGQLAALPEGSHAEACERPAIAISSPPFGAVNACEDPSYRTDRTTPGGPLYGDYGHEQGQLAQMPPGDHAAALAMSNTVSFKIRQIANRYPGAQAACEAWLSGSLIGSPIVFSPGNIHVYGVWIRDWSQCFVQFTDKRIVIVRPNAAAMEVGAETGRAQACISSPPFEGSLNDGLRESDREKYVEFARAGRGVGTNYGSSEGQLGQQQGSTFWAASRQILEQVYQVLAPGGHAIWVVKMFVRNKKLVDFPGQWEALCQSVGFKTVCKHRAWMNKDAGVVQVTLDYEEVSMEKWYKSFFRILCESKGSPRIDWELVLCMVKE